MTGKARNNASANDLAEALFVCEANPRVQADASGSFLSLCNAIIDCVKNGVAWGYDVAEEWAPRTHWTGSETRTGHFGTLEEEAKKYDGIRIKTSTEVAHLITNEAKEVIGVRDVNGVCYYTPSLFAARCRQP